MPMTINSIYSQPLQGNSVADSLSYQLQSAIKKNDPNCVGIAFKSLSKDVINTALPNGELPLHYAIRQSSGKVIKLLFEHPLIDLRKKDSQGLTLLDHAFLIHNREIKPLVLGHFFQQNVESIKKYASNVSTSQISAIDNKIRQNISYPSSDLSPLHRAAKRGSLEEVKNIVLFMLSATDLNKQTPTGETALYYAVQTGNEPVVQWLLARGARTDLLTNRKVSLLHIAALSNNNNIIKLLIEKGLNPNIPDNSGCTPLHYAALCEDFTNARTLIENGANPLVETHLTTPLAMMMCIARQRSHERDPLKIDLLQTLTCICSIAMWIQSCYGNETDLLTQVLSYLSSSLLSLTTTAHLFKIYRSSKDLRSLLTGGLGLSASILMTVCPQWLDAKSMFWESSLFLLFRTFVVSQSVLQGIKTSWRNRSLAPFRSFAKAVVHSTTIGLSAWHIHQRMKGIWNSYNLKIEMESQLANKECLAALQTASKMNHYYKNDALLDIVGQCNKDPSLVQEAISKIDDTYTFDNQLNRIVNEKLINKDCEGALENALTMNSKSLKDAALYSILDDLHCLKKQSDIAMKAVTQMHYILHRDEGFKKIVDLRLKFGNCEEALEAASKIYYKSTQDTSLQNIVNNPKCPPHATMKAASQISSNTARDEAFQIFVNQNLERGSCEEALEITSKIYYRGNKDNILQSIAVNPECMEMHPNVTTKAASQIHYAPPRDEAFQKLVKQCIKQKNCEEALEIASKIYYKSTQNHALLGIASHPECLKMPDIARRAVMQINSTTGQNDLIHRVAFYAFLAIGAAFMRLALRRGTTLARP